MTPAAHVSTRAQVAPRLHPFPGSFVFHGEGAVRAHIEDEKGNTPISTISTPLRRWPGQQPLLFLLLAGAVWFGLFQTLMPASEALVAALPVARDSHLGGAMQFFFYDAPKVLLLLTGIVFVMGVIALSLPEMVILRKVLKMRLIATFVGVVATGILIVGNVFNAVL